MTSDEKKNAEVIADVERQMRLEATFSCKKASDATFSARESGPICAIRADYRTPPSLEDVAEGIRTGLNLP